MGAYSEYSKMFRDGIVAKAKELNYSAANICVLNGDIEQLEKQFPQTYANLKSCLHNRDSRTPIEYARDLVASWIFEDTIVQKLNEAGLTTTLTGTDCNREILTTTKVSASSDCQISSNGKSRYLEIMSDYKGYWEKTGHMELRDSKYLKLESEKSLFLGVCTTSNKYILLDFAKEISANYIAKHKPYGDKPAYSITIEKAAMKKFFMPPLIADIKSALNDL